MLWKSKFTDVCDFEGKVKLKFYNNTSNLQDWEQTVRVTLQCGPYKGHIAFQVIGNQYGKNILCFYPDQLTPRDVDAFVENTCNMKIDPTRRFFHFDLRLEELDSTQHYAFPCMDRRIDNMIVAMEIIECKPYKKP